VRPARLLCALCLLALAGCGGRTYTSAFGQFAVTYDPHRISVFAFREPAARYGSWLGDAADLVPGSRVLIVRFGSQRHDSAELEIEASERLRGITTAQLAALMAAIPKQAQEQKGMPVTVTGMRPIIINGLWGFTFDVHMGPDRGLRAREWFLFNGRRQYALILTGFGRSGAPLEPALMGVVRSFRVTR
jgi:hypothetical protein